MTKGSAPGNPTIVVRKKKRTPELPASHPLSLPAVPSGTSTPGALGKPGSSSAMTESSSAESFSLSLGPVPPSPSKPQRQHAERRRRFLQSPEFTAISQAMVARWPQVFRVTAHTIRPLAVGIAKELCRQIPEYPAKLVHLAFNQWMADHRTTYWRALMRGGPRYDLEGNLKGEVTPEQQAEARQKHEEWVARSGQQKTSERTQRRKREKSC